MRPASARAAWPGNSSRVPSRASLLRSPYGSVGALRPGQRGKLDELLFQAAAQLDEETLCTHLDQIYQHNPHLRIKLNHPAGAKRPKSAGSWASRKETMQSLQERIDQLEKRCGVKSPKIPRVGGPQSHRRLRPKSAEAGSMMPVDDNEGSTIPMAPTEPERDPEPLPQIAVAAMTNSDGLEAELRESRLAESRLQEAQDTERKAREIQARERAKAEEAFREERLKCESLELARQAAIAKLEAAEKERESYDAFKEKYWKQREAEVLAKLKARDAEVERLNAQLLSYNTPVPPAQVGGAQSSDAKVSAAQLPAPDWVSAAQLPQPDWVTAEKQVRGVVARVNEAAERDRKAKALEQRWKEEKAVLLKKIKEREPEYDEVREKCSMTEQLFDKEVANHEAQAEKLARETQLVSEELEGARTQHSDQKAHIAQVIARKQAEYAIDLDNLRADLQAQATQTAEVAAWLCERDSVLRNLDVMKQRATELEQKQWQLRETTARLEEAGRTLDMEASAEWEELTNGCCADHDRIRAEIERWEQRALFLEERQRSLLATLGEMEANFGSLSVSRPSSAGGSRPNSRPTSLPGTRPTSANLSRGTSAMRPGSAGLGSHSPIPEAEGLDGLDPEAAAELAAWRRHAAALEERQRALLATLNDAQDQLDQVDTEEERREAEREELYKELHEMQAKVAQLEQQRNEPTADEVPE